MDARENGNDCGNSIASLAEEISRVTQVNGDYATAVPGLTLHRRSTAAAPMPCIYGFGLGVVAQGRKQVMLNENVYDYEIGRASCRERVL